jgi:signal transduction histidine kinase
MRDLVWGLDSRRDRVRNLLERMQEQSAEILNPADIAWQLDLGDLPIEKKIPVDVRQHLFLIFKEALTNTVRHSKATEVVVRFGNFDGRFELSVRDNGPFQEPKTAGTGLGLANMEMRARKIGGRLTVQHSAAGFCVRLQMRAI